MSPEATTFHLTPLGPTARSGREQERAAGYAAGYAAGARAAAEQGAQQRAALAVANQAEKDRRDAAVRSAVERLARAAAAADARTTPVVTDVRRVLAEASVSLAEAILGRELADGPTSAHAALDRAFSAGAELGVHTIRLSPADHALLVAEGVQLPEGVAVVADPRLAPGDAISELPAGFLDAQVATALERARRALLGGEA